MCGPHHCLGRDAFASGPEILRRLLQLRQNASILEQGCAGFSPGSANRCDQFTRHPGRTSSPLRPRLSCRYTQHLRRILRGYAAYYNVSRTHRSLNKHAPLHRAIERLGPVVSRPILGGLHHQYFLISAHTTRRSRGPCKFSRCNNRGRSSQDKYGVEEPP